MDYFFLSLIGSLIGTVSIVLIYIYLYILYRERFMGIWTISWLILLSRFVLFDSGLLPWKQSFLGMAIYQLILISSVFFFVWGTYVLINKPFHRYWLFATVIVSILSIALNLFSTSLALKLVFPLLFGSFAGIWIGLCFIRHLKLRGIGRLITGYAFILWSLLSLTLPVTVDIAWYAPWGYVIGGVLRLTITIGTLMVYFEKSRIDLLSKEAHYRLLAENSIDVIFSLQLLPEQKFDYISPSVLTTTGYSPEEYYADYHVLMNSIYPEDQHLFDDFIANFPHSIELPLTLRLICKDKSILWVEQKSVPIFNEEGDLIALQGTVRDITTRKHLEQIALTFDRVNMVGNMAASVAHEIRNPMTTVRGYLQVLGRKEKYQADKDKFTLMIEEIDRANAIIREYLSLSREKLVSFKKCSLNNIIQALFPLIQADALSSKVYISLELIPTPELLLDENEIRQVLLNLVRNGIEAMPAGGILVIRTFLEDNKVVLSISDQGSGIPSHILDDIGTPFISTKDNGTGLGLAICYQIAHRHQAHIKINTSQEGTTFLVYFNLPTP